MLLISANFIYSTIIFKIQSLPEQCGEALSEFPNLIFTAYKTIYMKLLMSKLKTIISINKII